MNITQEKIFELLCEFDHICRKHKIQYSICGGTALGAYRHQGFVPWDDDADVILTRGEFEKLDLVIKEGLPKDRVWVTSDTYPDYPLPFARYMRTDIVNLQANLQACNLPQGHMIDVFILDPIPSSQKEQ